MILMQILDKFRGCEQRVAVTLDGDWYLLCLNFRLTV